MPQYKDKDCKLCGIVFSPITGNQSFCDNCKDKAKKDRNKLYERDRSRKRYNYVEYIRNCLCCDKEFTTYYKKQLYCGDVSCEKHRLLLKSRKVDERRAPVRKAKNSELRLNRDLVIFEERSNYIKSYGYKILSHDGDYRSHKGVFKLLCPNNHEWKTTYHTFHDNGFRCFTCYISNMYTSKIESKIRDYFEKNYKYINVVYNDRKQISPKELDIYFPDHSLAIEVCGLYWHSEFANNKSKDYHYEKMRLCSEKGIRLITVFEDEIDNKFDIVISRILVALGLIDSRIYARKCIVREIDTTLANKFIELNHIQGSTPCTVSWGLFYNDLLVSAITLGRPTRFHTNIGNTLELKRFCSLKDYTVVGGAGKLFKRALEFARDNNYDNIKSYCDMRYANIFNPVYEKLGFKLVGSTKYTPHYFRNGVRYRNMSLRKTPDERLTGKTEVQLRTEQGYDRIWDCGHRTYMYEVDK